MGWMTGAFHGLAGAQQNLSMFKMKENAEREMEEARALRRFELEKYSQKMADRRLTTEMGYRSQLSEAERKAAAEQAQLDRESAEKQARIRASGA